MHPLILVI